MPFCTTGISLPGGHFPLRPCLIFRAASIESVTHFIMCRQVTQRAAKGQILCFTRSTRSQQIHDRASAITGSSRAARRAGHTLNRMPVPNAVPNAASTAHHGADTGSAG